MHVFISAAAPKALEDAKRWVPRRLVCGLLDGADAAWGCATSASGARRTSRSATQVLYCGHTVQDEGLRAWMPCLYTATPALFEHRRLNSHAWYLPCSLVLDLLRTVGDEFKRSYPAAAHTVLAPVVTAPPGAPQPTPAYAPPVPAPYYPPPGAPAYGYHHPPPGAPPPQYYPPPGSYAPPYGYAPPGAPPGAAGAPPPYGYALAGAPPPYAYAPPGAAPAPYGAPPPRPYAPAGAYPGSAPPGAYAPSGAGPGPAGAYQPPGTVAPAYASQPVQGSAAGAPAPAHGGAYGSSAAATGPAAAGAAAGGNSTVANNASGSGNGGPPKRKFREAREGEQVCAVLKRVSPVWESRNPLNVQMLQHFGPSTSYGASWPAEELG